MIRLQTKEAINSFHAASRLSNGAVVTLQTINALQKAKPTEQYKKVSANLTTQSLRFLCYLNGRSQETLRRNRLSEPDARRIRMQSKTATPMNRRLRNGATYSNRRRNTANSERLSDAVAVDQRAHLRASKNQCNSMRSAWTAKEVSTRRNQRVGT